MRGVIEPLQKEYHEAFDDELKSLKERVVKRAIDRGTEAAARLKKAEEDAAKEAVEERKARIASSPGGLDPLEVLESLPAPIKDAFEKQDTPALKSAFSALTPDLASYHFKRLVDSGLWVPAKVRYRDCFIDVTTCALTHLLPIGAGRRAGRRA